MVAGTVNYVTDAWSPVDAQVDCLGSGDDDIDREGRCATHLLFTCNDHSLFFLLKLRVYAA